LINFFELVILEEKNRVRQVSMSGWKEFWLMSDFFRKTSDEVWQELSVSSKGLTTDEVNNGIEQNRRGSWRKGHVENLNVTKQKRKVE